LAIIIVDFDVTGQLMIIYYTFVKYLRKSGNTTKQYNSFKKAYDSFRLSLVSS
jgi:hypothetical protein